LNHHLKILLILKGIQLELALVKGVLESLLLRANDCRDPGRHLN
jgi:hypothetical protein